MLAKVRAAFHELFRPDTPLLVGVSGGPDSVALLHALVALGWRPHVCHLNHQWRGRASAADAAFVRRLARELGLPATFARRKVPHDEDSARRARQAFFTDVARRTGITTLVLAHTADDLVETLLLRLVRGTGATGLAGIRPDRQFGSVRVIRPLLGTTRREVLAYLRAHGCRWREDASNRDRRFLRNRVRRDLLPRLERDYNPAVRDALRRTALILQEEELLLDRLTNRAAARATREGDLAARALARLPVALQRRVVRAWLPGIEFDQVEAVRALAGRAPTGSQVNLPGGVRVRREYDRLRRVGRETVEPPTGPWPLRLRGETRIPELEVRFRCARAAGRSRERARRADEWEASLDADRLGRAPFVRTWRPGDRFQPLGMRGTKKLQDLFVDEKVPRDRRARIPLVCATDGTIAWVVGCRLGDPFKVTARTRSVWRLAAGAVRD